MGARHKLKTIQIYPMISFGFMLEKYTKDKHGINGIQKSYLFLCFRFTVTELETPYKIE